MSTVHICPERDIECGRNPNSWCASCALRTPKERCDKCGITGIHACPGAPVPALTASSIQNLKDVLSEYAPTPIQVQLAASSEELLGIQKQIQAQLASIAPGVSMQVPSGLATLGVDFSVDFSSKSNLRPKAEAFDAIKVALEDPNQDGVLAKIRRVVSSIKD